MHSKMGRSIRMGIRSSNLLSLPMPNCNMLNWKDSACVWGRGETLAHLLNTKTYEDPKYYFYFVSMSLQTCHTSYMLIKSCRWFGALQFLLQLWNAQCMLGRTHICHLLKDKDPIKMQLWNKTNWPSTWRSLLLSVFLHIQVSVKAHWEFCTYDLCWKFFVTFISFHVLYLCFVGKEL